MNLKSKMQNKVTHVVKIISDTQAIMSDECSPTHVNALTIVEAADKQELWNKIRAVATAQAELTRFKLTIALIDQEDSLTHLSQPKPVAKPINLDEYTM